MDCMTKYGKLSDLKVRYFFLGARNAWDTVLIGPFKTKNEAERHVPCWSSKDIVQETTVTGFQALKILEEFEKAGNAA